MDKGQSNISNQSNGSIHQYSLQDYQLHISKISEGSQSRELIHSSLSIIYLACLQREQRRPSIPQAQKSQIMNSSKQGSLLDSSHEASRQFKRIHNNHLSMQYQQVALLLNQNKKEELSAQLKNKLLNLKLRQLKQEFKMDSQQISKDSSQLSQLYVDDQRNECLKFYYLSEKYKYLCKINKQILEDTRKQFKASRSDD